MADHEVQSARRLFGGVFARGRADTSDNAWLQAMLDAEAGLARALERAGLAPAGSGAAVTQAAQASHFDIGELGELAGLTGNPVPALARALARRVPQTAAGVVHRGATSQDIVDTAAMLLAKRAIDVVLADLARAAAAAAGLADAHRSTSPTALWCATCRRSARSATVGGCFPKPRMKSSRGYWPGVIPARRAASSEKRRKRRRARRKRASRR